MGAITGNSAVDAAATLTHDVERAFGNKEILTALAFDIKGAFDCATEKQLMKRLKEQGIPLTFIPRVAIFLQDRTAASEPVQIGVPQIFLVVPILFMLFTAPLSIFYEVTRKGQA